MKERLLEFLKAENKSSAQFAEEIGVQPSGISHILSGRNNPSLDFVVKMLEKYHYLSSDWLLFGKGDMYKDKGMQSLFNESVSIDNKLTPGNPEIKPDTIENLNLEEISKQIEKKEESIVEKIVWFYKDGSFNEYFPLRK